MSGHDIDMTIPLEIWTSDWSANTKIVFGYLWKSQGKNGCAWCFQDTIADKIKQPNVRTIQAAIVKLEASGHLRKLTSGLASRVAYQVRRSPEHEWPEITSDAAKKAKILRGQACKITAAGAANPAESSSSKFKRKNKQGNGAPPVLTFTDNTAGLFSSRAARTCRLRPRDNDATSGSSSEVHNDER